MLGVSFAPSRSVQLTLRPIRDGQLKVCAESCATLKREKPVLLGRWRRAGFENASKPELTWTKGEVVELNLDETDYLCHVWSGSGPRTYDEIHGVGKARYLGPDRFAVTLTAEADKSAHEYTARRLTNERIEVCDKARPCSTLERQFDPYLNIIDLGPSRALRSERRSAHSAPVRIPGTVLHPFPRLLIRQRERLSNFVDGADFTVDTVGLPGSRKRPAGHRGAPVARPKGGLPPSGRGRNVRHRPACPLAVQAGPRDDDSPGMPRTVCPFGRPQPL